MKTLALLLSLAVAGIAQAAPPEPGSVSDNVKFSLRSGNSFKSSSLKRHQNKILVVMLMTPWCPICQSHSKAVGDGILDHFNDPARGKLRGRNDRGVKIESILLSTEEAPQWDSVNAAFAAQNGFRRWGIDAKPNRSSPRPLLGYYRGGFINSTNLHDWGNDRRRLIIVNMVNRSPRHRFGEILVNQNSFSASDAASAIARINAVRKGKKKR